MSPKMSGLSQDIELERFLEAKRRVTGRRKRDLGYMRYENYKAIPYAFELGFDTLFIGSDVLEKIKKHWLQNDTEVGIDRKVAGILFGQKRGTQIRIEDCFRFKFSTNNDIITNPLSYKTTSEFLGIYSNGKIPDETDVTMVDKLSECLRESIFLLKYSWSEELNNVSTTVFENIFDVSKVNWMESLIFVQLHHHPPHETFITGEGSDCDREDSKVFYLDRGSPCVNRGYDPDITDYQRSKLKERLKLFYGVPLFWDLQDTLLKRAKDEKWFDEREIIWHDPGTDCVKRAEEFCEKAKLELRFSFKINLAGKNEISCYTEVVSYSVFGYASSIEESQCQSACSFLQLMRERLRQLLEEEKSSSNAENSCEQPMESSKTMSSPTAAPD